MPWGWAPFVPMMTSLKPSLSTSPASLTAQLARLLAVIPFSRRPFEPFKADSWIVPGIDEPP